MVSTERIEEHVAEEVLSQPVRVRTEYAQIIEEVKNGAYIRVTELTRGQVAALIRKAKDEGLRARGDAKKGTVVLAPSKGEAPPKRRPK